MTTHVQDDKSWTTRRKCHFNKSRVIIYNKIEDLPGDWDSILPSRHFLRTKMLQLSEAAALPDIRNLYIGYFEENRLLAVAYFQILSIRKNHLNDENLSIVPKFAWKIISGILCPRLLVAGHLFHHEISTFHTTVRTPYDAYVIYSSMMDECMNYSKANALLIKDIPPHLVPHFQNLKPNFNKMPNDISMEMKLDPAWSLIKDYEKSLKHKYAQRFRKVQAQLDGVSIREMDVTEVEKYKDKIFELYNQVAQNQQVRLGYLSSEYLPMLKREFDKAFCVWGFFKKEELIAFYSAWKYNGTLDMYYIGFDYESNRIHNLYFNMLFFGVKTAIEHQCKTLIMGRTALEAKARLGCEPKYLSTFIFIKNPLIRRWVNMMSPDPKGEEWENRHPFVDTRH